MEPEEKFSDFFLPDELWIMILSKMSQKNQLRVATVSMALIPLLLRHATLCASF
jgi:hypothetical protein